jgi:hypothetical protein
LLPTDADGAGRSGLALRAGALAMIALMPMLALVAPESHWDQPVLTLALGAIALVAYGGTIRIRPIAWLDGEFVAVLVAIAFLGPLPGMCVWLVTEAAYFLLDRHRLAAHLANVASYGWAALAGAAVLASLGAAPLHSGAGPVTYLALAAAGITMLCVNFAITRGIVGVLIDRQPVRATIREELIRPAPATLLMLVVGVATAFLYAHIGILALALFALVVLVPQTLLPVLLRPQPVRELAPLRAASLYALAIADVLELSPDRRLVLADAATFLEREPLDVVRGSLSCSSIGHCLDVRETVLYHGEHWDGPHGAPGAIGGDMIPLTSRVLAVAAAWARLTASGSPGLTHAQALAQIESRAGLHFDPRVVTAAVKIVATDKLGLAGDTAFQPHLDRLRLPSFIARLRALAAQTG